jgi:hypothetical protein
MKRVCIVVALLISTSAWAQVPNVGTRPLVQIKSKGQVTCKQVGNVKGTKLWAGDCVATEPTNEKVELPPIITNRLRDDD